MVGPEFQGTRLLLKIQLSNYCVYMVVTRQSMTLRTTEVYSSKATDLYKLLLIY